LCFFVHHGNHAGIADEASILVISNPGGWESPDASLSGAEISAVVAWVQTGGSLLLILDHAPAPGYAAKLTTSLGSSLA
jgi:hypothetical protein